MTDTPRFVPPDAQDAEDYASGAGRRFPFRSPDVEVKPEVHFLTGEPEKGINVVPAKTTSTVKVRVREPFRVVVDGVAYVGGDVVDAPATDTTNSWVAAGYVERVTAKRGK